MASVHELLAAAEAKDNSPLRGFLSGLGAGLGEGYAAAPSRMSVIQSIQAAALRMEQEREDRLREAEMHKVLLARVAGEQENQTQDALGGVGKSAAKPPLAGLRLAGAVLGEHGYLKPKFESVEPKPKAREYAPREYQDEDGRTRIGKWDKTAGLITGPDDPYAKQGAGGAMGKPSVAENAVDREFGREYARYVAEGGYADTERQIASLESVMQRLRSGGEQLTGPFLTLLPDAVRKRTYPASMAAQQLVEQSVQRTLKQTLGGQFTEKEGVGFMQRGYDPTLPEEENVAKLEWAISQLKRMAGAKRAAAEYFEANGTLKGFKGNLPSLTGTAAQPRAATTAAQPATAPPGWRIKR